MDSSRFALSLLHIGLAFILVLVFVTLGLRVIARLDQIIKLLTVIGLNSG